VAAQPMIEPAGAIGREPTWATTQAVTAVAEDLAGEFSLRPLLERILAQCTELLDCDAGSICSVDLPSCPPVASTWDGATSVSTAPRSTWPGAR
jgi:hypothetical protein